MLARLRIPTGWLVQWNTLTEAIGDTDLPDLDGWSRDLLLLSHERRRVVIDLAWYPDNPGHMPHGAFVLCATRLENDQDAAVEANMSPLRVQESSVYSEIITVLEAWLEDETLATSPKDDQTG